MVKNNNQLNKSYQYPPRDKEILAKMSHPDHEGNFLLLPTNASSLEKIKHKLCKKLLAVYKQDNNLTVEELAEKINLSSPETKEILLCHIHKFTLDRLTYYLTNLFPKWKINLML